MAADDLGFQVADPGVDAGGGRAFRAVGDHRHAGDARRRSHHAEADHAMGLIGGQRRRQMLELAGKVLGEPGEYSFRFQSLKLGFWRVWRHGGNGTLAS